MTLNNYKAIFSGKSSDEISLITSAFIKYAISYKGTLLCFSVFLIILLVTYFVIKSLKTTAIRLFFTSLITYFLYQAGNLAMYLFSMPTSEAIRLAAIERYTKTILIAILYILMILVIQIISEASINQTKVWSITLLIAAFTVYLSYATFHQIRTPFYYADHPEKRLWLESQIQKYKLPESSSYCFLLPQNDSGYFDFLGRYEFDSSSTKSRVIDSYDDFSEITEKYVIIYDTENDIINQWIEDNYPNQIGNTVIIREDN